MEQSMHRSWRMMPGAMRRLLRILLNAATVLSLVLCLGTAVFGGVH
jgi:hypothetical protein